MKISLRIGLFLLTLFIGFGCFEHSLLKGLELSEMEFCRNSLRRDKDLEYHLNGFNLVRQKLFDKLRESPIAQLDTLLLFEAEDIVSHTIYGAVWCRLDSLNYWNEYPWSERPIDTTRRGPIISRRIIECSLAADFDAILTMAKQDTGVITPANMVSVFRAVRIDGHWNVLCSQFIEYSSCYQ
jgi:hypothetical protein